MCQAKAKTPGVQAKTLHKGATLYVFLKPPTSFPMINFATLTRPNGERLVKVLRDNKEAFGWTIHDIKSNNPAVCTHWINMEDKYEPRTLSQRHLNPNTKEVVKGEVLNLLDTGIIYPIFDSKCVSLVEYVAKKGGTTVMKNDQKELITDMNITTVWMGTLVICKSPWQRNIKKKLFKLAHMRHLHIKGCPLVYVMLLPPF
ncbi:hypothetical protein CR513_59382, partial [Mucuna pruriens]